MTRTHKRTGLASALAKLVVVAAVSLFLTQPMTATVEECIEEGGWECYPDICFAGQCHACGVANWLCPSGTYCSPTAGECVPIH